MAMEGPRSSSIALAMGSAESATVGGASQCPDPCPSDRWCAGTVGTSPAVAARSPRPPAVGPMDSARAAFKLSGFGSKLGGIGPPLMAELMGKQRNFVDGGGLCSPGLWPPSRRKAQSPLAADCFAALHRILYVHLEPRKLLFELACRKHKTNPFPEAMLSEARVALCDALTKHGGRRDLDLQDVPARQPFRLALLEEFLRICGDPDAAAFYSASDSFAQGVRIGVNTILPRTPSVFEPKTKWRNYEGELEADLHMRSNYPTAIVNADVLEQQFEEEEKLGAMVKMPQVAAQDRYGAGLRIASLGAIQKADNSFRVIHDGTHGTGVNGNIHVRDQLVCPTAGDVRQAMRSLENATFVLTADVKRTHRLVKVHPDDWGYQACKAKPESEHVWLNTVGSFGVASAAVHWARLMSGLQRAVFYLLGRSDVFLLTYVDDLLWLVRGSAAMDAVAIALLFLVTLGLPLSWPKCQGGTCVDWVGYRIDLEKWTVGINAKRTRWLTDWCEQALAEGIVRLADFRSVLGRFSFAFAAMEHLRPFLAPLYAWCAAVNAKSARLPDAVALSLSYIKYMLESGISSQRVLRQVPMQRELFRADAKAEGEEIWIGGWCVADSADLSRCRWFSERLNRQNASWAFLAGEPFRAIASLEMLATLVGLVVFGLGAEGRASVSCSASTDNLGNTCVLRRWLTTKYPLSCFVMEIAALLAKANVELNLLWLPRLQNIEADALTNSDYRGFNPDLRQEFCLEEYEGLVLKQMLAAGEELNTEIKAARQKKQKCVIKDRTPPLRVRDPWDGP